ncbi:choline dehydrogenase-like flavoprotein [Dyadobacter jejuensis]|uniref:Choline dehydrogenase-like flavoprotein n=1 Tax=Dyadobacter jejuensis TaxID=1082580 RepID=A0A316AAY2_9BACT|nr:GMC family oxidoreductase [Dyadobacter jejuensis]PWJ54996.1 choline dehydrogenase-like flavoprotein [Dyadobacter jejuensis]
MKNLKNSNTFDAIVVGSGMSGGWAVKELTERGLKTLVLERGRDVRHIVDYPTTHMMPWEFEHRGTPSLAIRQANPIASKHYIFKEDAMHFVVKDDEHPYVQEKPFDWMRGYQVGGRSLLWARQTQRWSDYDFEGPLRDGFAVDWPIRYKDLAPWYSYVEKFVGITGHKDQIPHLPDGEFLPAFEMSCLERHFSDRVKEHYKGKRHVITARAAHITEAQPIHLEQGRAKCQHRAMCQRGCPFGGYFSSNSSTLPWAERTGNMTLRPHSVVHSVIYDENKKKAVGVRVVDAITKQTTEYFAKLIFLNASALNTNLILLNSKSKIFPNGLGNDSGTLGKYIGFHNYSGRVTADYDGLHDFYADGRRPTGGYIPRFRNVDQQETDFLRGYSVSFGSQKKDKPKNDWGVDLKNNLLGTSREGWAIGMQMMGETIPKEHNWVRLDENRTDDWGIPLLKMSVDFDENDQKMLQDFYEQLSEMLAVAGFTNIKTSHTHRNPGSENHEMGGVRMGRDPQTSLLNAWNQLHACPNVIVTDGSCMTSTATQNPSLTYMALAARAVDHVVKELKNGNL